MKINLNRLSKGNVVSFNYHNKHRYVCVLSNEDGNLFGFELTDNDSPKHFKHTKITNTEEVSAHVEKIDISRLPSKFNVNQTVHDYRSDKKHAYYSTTDDVIYVVSDVKFEFKPKLEYRHTWELAEIKISHNSQEFKLLVTPSYLELRTETGPISPTPEQLLKALKRVLE